MMNRGRKLPNIGNKDRVIIHQARLTRSLFLIGMMDE